MIFNLERFFLQHLDNLPLLNDFNFIFLKGKHDGLADAETYDMVKVPVEIQKMHSKNYYLNQY